MKTFINIPLLLLLISNQLMLSMEERDKELVQDLAESSADFGTDKTELIDEKVLSDLFDLSSLHECRDMYEALDCLHAKLKLNSIKSEPFKKRLKEIYTNFLTDKFLELRDGGLYPKNDIWCLNPQLNELIGLSFVAYETKHDVMVKIIICRDFSERSLRHKIIGLLLLSGADPHAKDERGCTFLHRAIRYNNLHFPDENIKIIETLLSYGIDVNAQNKNNETALHYALDWYKDIHGMMNVIGLLLSHKADITIQNRKGETVLDIAERKELFDVVELLNNHADQDNNLEKSRCSLV